MLGPDCVLVRRTGSGFACLMRDEARAIQAAVLGHIADPDWLFAQTRRIAAALGRGEIALTQIYGLHIPIAELEDAALRKLAAARLLKAGFNPDEPRVPQGEPGAGEWTFEPGYANPRAYGDDAPDMTAAPASTGAGKPRLSGSSAPPEIPPEPPGTPPQRTSFVRRSAEWLRRAAALGAAFAPDTRAKAFFAALEATAWVAEYLPEILSYLDAPNTLEELQKAVADPQPGYQIHHIVEGQYGSSSIDSNAERFGRALLESPENLVLIPKWKHVEISSWYSTQNKGYGELRPRAYLRGKSWEEQYTVGIQKIRDFGVMK